MPYNAEGLRLGLLPFPIVIFTYSYVLCNGGMCRKEHIVSEFKKRKREGVGCELQKVRAAKGITGPSRQLALAERLRRACPRSHQKEALQRYVVVAFVIQNSKCSFYSYFLGPLLVLEKTHKEKE